MPVDVEQFRTKPRYVVAAELDDNEAPRAHAVGDVGDLTVRHGVALCGLPVEALAIVPDLDWDQVRAASRCDHCEEAMPVRP